MNERERIELLMKSYGMTPSQFADRTGIQRASVSHIISGRNKPSLEVLQKIYDAFPELDIKWLMTGIGEKPVANSENDNEVPVLENSLFSPEPQPLNPVTTIVQKDSRSLHIAGETVRYDAPTQQAKPHQVIKPVQRKATTTPKVRQQVSQERKIKEIRIFYTDGTYETMYPEK